MAHVYVRRLAWFIGLALLQVLVLNHIHVAGYATPFLYIYFILKFDAGISRNELMLWGFFLGLSVDIFSCTPGMNAAATVLLAFARPTILRLFSSRDTFDDFEPGFKNIGASSFIKYVVAGVLLQNTALLAIESFSFFDLPVLLLKIITSSLLTVLCILGVEGIRK